LNRFYGVFSDGKIKARGIEVRHGDSPKIVEHCQNEMLQELANAKSLKPDFENIVTIQVILSFVKDICKK
jgi:DNA polymerase elongation subunit (family B)